MEGARGEVTNLLLELNQGHHQAEERLIPLVYHELRRIAGIYLRKEAADHSLQPTALVHEAYLRLTGMEQVDWQGRSHFFAISAKTMRRILVDHARAKRAEKRGNGWDPVLIEDAMLPAPQRGRDILALDDALNRLAELDLRKSKIVEMRFFGGMTEEEIGEVLGVTARTVKRHWRAARAWLYAELLPSS